MKHSRTEVRRWRMLRQQQRQKLNWIDHQSRRNRRIFSLRKQTEAHRRTAILYAMNFELPEGST